MVVGGKYRVEDGGRIFAPYVLLFGGLVFRDGLLLLGFEGPKRLTSMLPN